MKKRAFISIAVAMMSILFVGCEKENTQVEPDRDVANKIIGKWITAESDSKVLPTNEKIVYDFVSATEAYVSLSFTETTNGGTPWSVRDDVDVDIVGNDIILTHNPEPGTTVVVNIHVNAITGTTLIGKRNITVRKDGGLVRSEESMIRCEKLDMDYSTKILGLWEGKMTSEQSAFDDGQEHRWEFKDDGSFVFYIKNDKGIWEAKDDEYAEYFVAGNLLCTRWKNTGEGSVENREWWEIATAGNKSMVWTALRENADGSQYTAAFSMEKVSVPTQDEVEKAIVGKWITAQADGKALPTNEKIVFDIVSPTEAYVSLSIQDRTAEDTPWRDREEVDVEIDGNDVILSHSPKPGMIVMVALHIESITDATLIAKRTVTIRQDGGLVRSTENMVRYEKLNVDYRNAICGMWEGMSTGAEGSEFDDGENHRWEYMTDGTFNYFRKVNGRWQLSDDDYADYFVAGNLLCTRWKNAGAGNEEHREWWEIESIKDGVMKWKALRQREDGTTYTATFEMRKVDVPTEAEVEQNIIGRWMTTQMDFQDIPTNTKIVFEFESLTKAYYYASLNSVPELPALWNKKTELSVAIIDNHIWLTGQKDEHTAFLYELIISEMSADRMECVTIYSEINDKGETVTSPVFFTTNEKVDDDFSADVIGTWEGQVTSEQDTYGDGLQHRWEYKADGTYVYYVKEGDNWVPSANTLNEYFVAGRLLCMRWINGRTEYREWWEIDSIENGVMKWKALRKNAEGTTFTSTFQMSKITE